MMFDRETKREKSLEQIKKQGGGAKKDLIMEDLDLAYVVRSFMVGRWAPTIYLINGIIYNPWK